MSTRPKRIAALRKAAGVLSRWLSITSAAERIAKRSPARARAVSDAAERKLCTEVACGRGHRHRSVSALLRCLGVRL